MLRFSCLLLITLLAACGMQGDLYEPPPTAISEPVADDADKGDRKSIPAAPDPALSR